MHVEVRCDVLSAPEEVWDALVEWESQPSWMLDAKDVEVLTPRREGVGVKVRVPTNAMGFTLVDVMEVTGWRPAQRLEVRHVGRLIKGTGAFELSPVPGGTRVRWWEDVDPPLGAVGELVARTLVAPYLRRLFARSLRRFKKMCERRTRGRPAL